MFETDSQGQTSIIEGLKDDFNYVQIFAENYDMQIFYGPALDDVYYLEKTPLPMSF